MPILIEDNDDDAQLIVEKLAAAGGTPSDLAHADRLAKGLQRLSEGGRDLRKPEGSDKLMAIMRQFEMYWTLVSRLLTRES